MSSSVKRSVYDEFPGLKTFISNMPDAKIDNVYIIQCEDQDGNITDTKYGLNLIPDVYFNSLNQLEQGQSQGRDRWFLMIVEDTNDDPSSYTDMGILYGEGSRKINATVNNNDELYTAHYDSVTGYITQQMKIGSFVYDYNYQDITSDMEINRMYLNSNDRALAEVSIYDSDGNFSGFTKHLNERVTVTVICTGYIHEDVITSAYTNGLYLVLNPGYAAVPCNPTSYRYSQWGSEYLHYEGSYKSTYPRKATISSSPSYNRNWTYVNNVNGITGFRNGVSNAYIDEFSQYANDEYLLIDQRMYVSKSMLRSKYYGGTSSGPDVNYNDSFWMFTEEKLSDAENIVIDPVYTDSSHSPSMMNSFAKLFDPSTWTGYVPCVDFNLTDVKGWNHASKDWDIDIQFTNASSAYYDNPFIDDSLTPIFIEGYTAYVRINPHVSTKSLLSVSFSDDSPAPLYATDKYWDTSSWTRIYDPSNIPAAQRNKKYYITTDKSNGEWYPIFDQTVHSLDTNTSVSLTGLPATSELRKTYYGFRPVGNYSNTLTWFLTQEHVIIPYSDSSWGTPEVYRIDGPEVRDGVATPPCANVLRFAYQNKLMVGSVVESVATHFPTAIRIYDIENRTVGTSIPYTDISLDIGTVPNNLIGMFSSSKNGFFIIHNSSAQIANIINVDAETLIKLENVQYCYALEYTNHCVYQKTDAVNTRTYGIYDMENNVEIATFVLPEQRTTLQAIFGYRDHVYIRTTNGTDTYLDMYDVSNQTITNCPDLMTPFKYRSETATRINTYGLRANQCAGAMFSNDFMILSDQAPSHGGQEYPVYVLYSDPTTTYPVYLNGNNITYYNNKRAHDESYLANSFVGMRPGMLSYVLDDPSNTQQQKRVYLMNPYAPLETTNASAIIIPETFGRPVVTDIGYIVDHQYDTGAEPVINHFTPEEGNYYLNAVYFNNGIIVFNATGTGATWYDIENFLPHQLSGSTYTIQCWNNPVSISGKNFLMYKTNRANITSYQAPTKWAGMDWGIAYYHTDGSVRLVEDKCIIGLITPPHQTDYKVLHAGDVVRCEAKLKTEYDVSPNTGNVQFAVMSFQESTTGYGYKRSAMTSYVSADGVATITMANESLISSFIVYLNTGNYVTWPGNARICLTPNMFEYIKVWVNDVLLS